MHVQTCYHTPPRDEAEARSRCRNARAEIQKGMFNLADQFTAVRVVEDTWPDISPRGHLTACMVKKSVYWRLGDDIDEIEHLFRFLLRWEKMEYYDGPAVPIATLCKEWNIELSSWLGEMPELQRWLDQGNGRPGGTYPIADHGTAVWDMTPEAFAAWQSRRQAEWPVGREAAYM